MKMGIGIDTGGTCTDAVIYQFDKRQILASAKTATTKEDLSIGISKALSALPRDLINQCQILALSTTLATNACVENKGGRARLIFFGVNPENVARTGSEYGLTAADNPIFIDCKTKPNGQIVKEPDWEQFRETISQELQNCDAAAVVEMFAKKSGAAFEKQARSIIQERFPIPVVCGHELFEENNIIKRGASTLLNARLIPVITDFTASVKRSLKALDIRVPFVIVRSDGSLMSEDFAKEHPIETLLCGPVASVMGAAELTSEQNCIVVDMGGTTTDIAFVKNGIPQSAKNGVHIGRWNTFVKGLFVDTFGLGGDSGVELDSENRIRLTTEKFMPICMAAEAFPALKSTLLEQSKNPAFVIGRKEQIYAKLKGIRSTAAYTEEELAIADLLEIRPMSLGEIETALDQSVLPRQLDRLLREGVIIRCGITPTDAMHVLKDFNLYDAEASKLALSRMSRVLKQSEETICHRIYDEVKQKLYFHVVRILIEDSDSNIHTEGIDSQLAWMIHRSYKSENPVSNDFLNINFSSSAALIGVGAPTHLFLPEVAEKLHAKVVLPAYCNVANALGAVVGNVTAKVIMEVSLDQQTGSYTVFGKGDRYILTDLEEAKALADRLAKEKATEEALARGAQDVKIQVEGSESIIDTNFGPVFMGYKAVATAAGEIQPTSSPASVI